MTLLETILTNTYTKADLEHRLGLLKEFLEFQFFKPHQNLNLTYLLNDFINEKKEPRDEFNALFAWGFDFFNRFKEQNLYENLKEIGAQSLELPVVEMFLPIVLPIYEVPKLGNWLRENVSKNILVDLRLDPKLIGGCALAWKGTYRDFSLRFYIEKRKESVQKVIEDYLDKGESGTNIANPLHQP